MSFSEGTGGRLIQFGSFLAKSALLYIRVWVSIYSHRRSVYTRSASYFVLTAAGGQRRLFIAMAKKVMEVKSIQDLNEVLWKEKID